MGVIFVSVSLLFFFLVENLVGTTGYLQRLRMLLNKTVDVANTLLFQNLVHGNENTRFLYITETIVDGGAEELLVRLSDSYTHSPTKEC